MKSKKQKQGARGSTQHAEERLKLHVAEKEALDALYYFKFIQNLMELGKKMEKNNLIYFSNRKCQNYS